MLQRLTGDPERPYVVVLGGAKVSDKLGVIDNLLDKADRMLIGGGMCFTFLTAQGHEMGKSLLEADQIDTVQELARRGRARGVEIVLPIDIVGRGRVRRRRRADSRRRRRDPGRPLGLDIGPDSAASCSPPRSPTRATVFWNGPMGVFEFAAFAGGHPGRRPGARPRSTGPDGGRRRRLRGRGAQARLRRGRVRPHLHRRRRQPGVPRGQAPCPVSGAGRRQGRTR